MFSAQTTFETHTTATCASLVLYHLQGFCQYYFVIFSTNTNCILSWELRSSWVITQRIMATSYRRFGTVYQSHLQGACPLNVGPIDCPETSVTNHHYTLRNDSEDSSSRLLRGRSLKSRIVQRLAHPLLSFVYPTFRHRIHFFLFIWKERNRILCWWAC